MTHVSCFVKADRLGLEHGTSKSEVQRPTAEPPRNTYHRVENTLVCGGAAVGRWIYDLLVAGRVAEQNLQSN